MLRQHALIDLSKFNLTVNFTGIELRFYPNETNCNIVNCEFYRWFFGRSCWLRWQVNIFAVSDLSCIKYLTWLLVLSPTGKLIIILHCKYYLCNKPWYHATLKKLFITKRVAKVICDVPKNIYSWPSGGHGQWHTAINNVETSQVFMPFVSCSTAMQLLQWATETAAIAITLEEKPAVALWYNGWHKPEKIIALSMLIAYPPPYSDFLSSFNCAHHWRLHACSEFWH